MAELPPRVINLISRQVLKLQAQPPEGVLPLIDEDDPTNVQAESLLSGNQFISCYS